MKSPCRWTARPGGFVKLHVKRQRFSGRSAALHQMLPARGLCRLVARTLLRSRLVQRQTPGHILLSSESAGLLHHSRRAGNELTRYRSRSDNHAILPARRSQSPPDSCLYQKRPCLPLSLIPGACLVRSHVIKIRPPDRSVSFAVNPIFESASFIYAGPIPREFILQRAIRRRKRLGRQFSLSQFPVNLP